MKIWKVRFRKCLFKILLQLQTMAEDAPWSMLLEVGFLEKLVYSQWGACTVHPTVLSRFTLQLLSLCQNRQISSLNASRQLKEATADNAVDFLYYNRNNKKKLISSLHLRGFPTPQKFFPTTDSFKTSQGTWGMESVPTAAGAWQK